MKVKTTSALTKLRSYSNLLNDRLERQFLNLRDSMLIRYDIDQANAIFNRLCDDSQIKSILSEVTDVMSHIECQNGTPNFIMGSELIYNAYNKLCSIPTESILYAAGNNFGNSYSVERLIDLQLDKSEYGYASANSSFSSKVLIDLEQYGTLLTCYFHAHPGSGINSNRPSGIDYSNQKRLETGNYNTIGGIFSRDGYLRFFSDNLPYTITISGKGVEHVSQNVYKLTEVSKN